MAFIHRLELIAASLRFLPFGEGSAFVVYFLTG